MATGHGFSVLANCSVKQPINPKTGLVTTSFERVEDVRRSTEVVKDDSRQDNGSPELSGTAGQTEEEEEFDDSSFYEKLVELKEAHKKTLVMWEKLYKEKKTEIGEPESGQLTRSRLASLENILNSEVRQDGLDGSLHMEPNVQSNIIRDQVKDLSSTKPPSGKLHTSQGIPSKSLTVGRSSVDEIERTSSTGSLRYRTTMSADFIDYETSEDEQFKEERKSQSHVNTRQSAMARIEDMWETFSVDNYCPRSSAKTKAGLFRSNSLSNLPMSYRDLHRKTREKTPRRVEKKATVPQPFSMTIRDGNKTPKKSRVVAELLEREEERRRSEDLECQKKFKAMPLPAHVHLRMYDEMKEERETRRRDVLQNRLELLQMMQKPFQFTIREEKKEKSTDCDSALIPLLCVHG